VPRADATVLAEANAALELAKARAERAVRIDPLTATTTRRHGMQIIRRAVRGAPHGPSTMGVLLVDVDHFKVVNDTWGHAAGDAVLAEVARRVKQSLRLGDVTVRWGGEEFLVLLPHAPSLEVVMAVAERIRARVSDIDIRFGDATQRGHVRVSIGALFVAPPTDASTVLAEADAALYRAKAAGRDQVVGELFSGR
jgi:diguanylate cyclase (GGDEF)-like protein